jgi:AcrR family transcriptional regulator
MEAAVMRQQERRARTTMSLRIAARDLFAGLGYEGASLDAVAFRAGFSKGAIYVHFPAKQDLFRDVAVDALDDARDRIRLLLSTRPLPTDPVSAAVGYFSVGPGEHVHVGLLCEIWRRARLDAPIRSLVDSFTTWRMGILAEAGGNEWAVAVARLIDGETAERRLQFGATSESAAEVSAAS